MPLDFEKIISGSTVDSILPPREIYSALPNKYPRFRYLHDVQAEVLGQWYDRRDTKDLVIKMNTGSGKTLVGLLILKSGMNEKRLPALYVAADTYLVTQVTKEASDLGIKTTDDPADPSYIKGDSICVINIYKLINGKSVFGVGDEGVKIEIGSIVIDDAHACLSSMEDQFTLKIDASMPGYKELLKLFSDSLRQQSEMGFLEIQSQDPLKNMLVPFWSWINQNREVAEILYKVKDDPSIKFKWPLIKNILPFCRCVFGGNEIEITPRCLPINTIPSFTNAKRRIYMTATLYDDSILVTNFNACPESVKNTITPEDANDIGDRMILIPQEINTSITDDDIKDFLKKLAAQYNIVVIVPSAYRSTFWQDVACSILNSSSLSEGVSKLKAGHVGLTVLLNKYDGIDLPDDACRILVIDGIPDVRRKIDRIEQAMLQDSELMITKEIQRVEQGMGRGIRGINDQCIVILMNPSLVRKVYSPGAMDKFSASTKAQINLSSKVAEQLKGKSLTDFLEIIDYSLKKDPRWLKASKGALAGIKYDTEGNLDPLILKQREAFDAAQVGDYDKSITLLQDAVNISGDKRITGFLKQELAEYWHYNNKVESQKILKSALNDNPRLLKPLEGITYAKIPDDVLNQAKQCSDFLIKYSSNFNKLIIHINAINEDLQFGQTASTTFEEALKNVSELLGYQGQRPEQEIGKGPDVFWRVGNNVYFIFACKNGATSRTIPKRYCDQLSGHLNWFKEEYGKECKGIPIIIHPSTIVDDDASPCSGMRVIDMRKLDLLRTALREMGKSVVASDRADKVEKIQVLLNTFNFTSDNFINNFTSGYTEMQ